MKHKRKYERDKKQHNRYATLHSKLDNVFKHRSFIWKTRAFDVAVNLCCEVLGAKRSRVGQGLSHCGPGSTAQHMEAVRPAAEVHPRSIEEMLEVCNKRRWADDWVVQAHKYAQTLLLLRRELLCVARPRRQ